MEHATGIAKILVFGVRYTWPMSKVYNYEENCLYYEYRHLNIQNNAPAFDIYWNAGDQQDYYHTLFHWGGSSRVAHIIK